MNVKNPTHEKTDESLGEISYYKLVSEKESVLVPFPAFITEDIREKLVHVGISSLFKHQSEALTEIYNGRNVILSTGTASGKSLCYQIPIMDILLHGKNASALMIFPTKALAQDQFHSLKKMIPEFSDVISIFDGDTPGYQRSSIKTHSRIILTNPDMLHLGILPYHSSWTNLFQNVRYVILDEAHIYRGIFGSHVANVFRRFHRISHRYGAAPQFILCSATLTNAKILAEKLIEEEITEISEDDSGNGSRQIYFINPPVVDQKLFLRAGSIYTASKLSQELMHKKQQTLVFCQSRQSVESAVVRMREYGIQADGYRSGYLPKERRLIEQGLKDGSKQCVVATNALEIGMDIGGMDSVVSVGYPGSISAVMQRIGRAGRNHRNSSFYLIASQNPVDQYVMKHPDFISERKCEPVLIDPDNVMILFQHLQCALFESPFSEKEAFGNLSVESTQELLHYLVSVGIARYSGGQYFWMKSELPQGEVSLRNSSMDRISIIEERLNKFERIGEVDQSSSYWMVHQGAIYFHNGISYHIESLNLEEKTALAKRIDTFYTTEAVKECTITPTEIHQTVSRSNCDIMTADVTVTSKVTAYKKIDKESFQVLDLVPLDLPQETLETKAFIIVLKTEFQEDLRKRMLWNNDENNYGPAWPSLRKMIIQRDGNKCQNCGITSDRIELQVHHIVPFRQFSDPDKANDPSNLITLCPDCHKRAEAAVRMRSGLSGFASAFHQMASLFLECAPDDILLISEPECTNFDGKPVIYLHEVVTGGIGLSESLFDNFEKIAEAALDLIENCGCEDGCPGCIGPGGENGAGGKKEAIAIGKGLLSHEG